MASHRKHRLKIALLTLLPLFAATARAGLYVVDSTGDGADILVGDKICDDGSGACTLRAAIEESNGKLSFDVINFALLGVGPHTIRLTESLPDITDHNGTTIDGSSQPGWSGRPLIEIDASAVTAGHAIRGVGGHVVLRSLIVNGAGTHGIVFSGLHLNLVQGCWIGLDATGLVARPNQVHGIFMLDSDLNRIGGPNAGDGNVISGNGVAGIYVSGENGDGNAIEGNWIGLDASGQAAVPNGIRGINLDDCHDNVIGGMARGAGNVIVGHLLEGVLIAGANALRNSVLGNWIGTGSDLAAGLGNLRGVVLDGASETAVGAIAAGNVISGNFDAGIVIRGATALGNSVLGNYIGVTGATGDALANGGPGVLIERDAGQAVIGAADNGAGNFIARNGGSGVVVETGVGTRIVGNAIDHNGGIGIDLGTDAGPTANDPGDADGGANDLQNSPVLASAEAGCATTTVNGTLESLPGASFDLDFYASDACDPSGFGEGGAWLGRSAVTTDGAGVASFSAVLPARVAPGRVVTATATNAPGSTSELSSCLSPTDACASCGNSRVDPGEDCDTGGVDTPTCDSDCTDPVCGDNHHNAAANEQCDDGNTQSGDGCSSTCQSEICSVGALGRIQGVRAVKAPGLSVGLSWLADPFAAAYHVNSVTDRSGLADPHRSPGLGAGECEATPPATACDDAGALVAPPALLFYQVLSACGATGAEEGPF